MHLILQPDNEKIQRVKKKKKARKGNKDIFFIIIELVIQLEHVTIA